MLNDISTRKGPKPTVSSRAVVAVAAGVGLVVAVACSPSGQEELSGDRALQAVETSFDASAAIHEINNTIIVFDDETGETHSQTEEFEVGQVVDDLPLRVSTQYRTDEGAGTDLGDLQGHSGRVEIDITLENLLVSTEEISYDVAGESRQTTALVGVPISVAASANFEEISAGSIISTDDEDEGTNGVIGAGPQGQATVQWAAVLAPPQTEAAATLSLVADVKDFEVPTINISAQPGLRSDMSFGGVMESVFGPDLNAELAAQQEVIDTVIDVNEVLNRAGETITELRSNLNETSETLGVEASHALQTSTEDLTTRMEELQQEITGLGDTMSESMEDSQTEIEQATEEMMASALELLGAKGDAPQVTFDTSTCITTGGDSDGAQSIYGQFEYVSALLEGYADAAETCQKDIAKKLKRVIGPESVGSDVCRAEKTTSVTCALHDTRTQVQGSLKDLKKAGERVINKMTDEHIRQAATTRDSVDELLTAVDDLIEEIPEQSATASDWENLKDEVRAAEEKLHEFEEVRTDLRTLQQELTAPNGALVGQQQGIAESVCDVVTNVEDMATQGDLDPDDAADLHGQLDAIRAQIVDVQCDGSTPYDERLVPEQGTVMETVETIDTQVDQIITQLDTDESDSVISLTQELFTQVEDTIEQMQRDSNTNQTRGEQVREDLLEGLAEVGSELHQLKTDIDKALQGQEELKGDIEQAFTDAVDDGHDVIDEAVEDNIAHVSDLGERQRDNLNEAYSTLIDGLRESAESSIEDGKGLVDKQQEELAKRQDAATTTFDEHTVTALDRIETSSQAATRNISAASEQLGESLQRVILDLGDPEVEGSGILGAIATNAAMTDSADYQLALASQNVSGFANVRSESIEGIMLQQALLTTTLEKSTTQPPFHAEMPEGMKTQTIYTFTLNALDE